MTKKEDLSPISEEKIKNSFNKVKEDINIAFSEIREIKTKLSTLNEKIDIIIEKIDKISIYNEKEGKLGKDFFYFSTGNEGVINDQQRSTTMINDDQQRQTINNNDQQSPDTISVPTSTTFSRKEHSLLKKSSFSDKEDAPSLSETNESPETPTTNFQKKEDQGWNELSLFEKKDKFDSFLRSLPSNSAISSSLQNLSAEDALIKLSQNILSKFNSLTDREFSIFQAILTLEKNASEVTYSDLSNLLKISESTIRAATNSLISKGVPLIKSRPFNKKVSLSIPDDLKSFNLLSKLIAHRLNAQQVSTQKTLFDL